ncbi:cupin domain-containing protein [Nocardiopsis coralliicola]
MEIVRGRSGAPSENRTSTFTGSVWADPVLPATDGVTANNVFFAPGARTHWHHHERGQILHVTAGSGLICTDGEAPRSIAAGDTVWIPAGERHWHGGGPDSALLHLAVSLGPTHWSRAVTDTEYGARG